MGRTYETEVQLTDGTRFHPDKVVMKDNGWVLCIFDVDKHYFPPHRVKEVNKVAQVDDSDSTDA